MTNIDLRTIVAVSLLLIAGCSVEGGGSLDESLSRQVPYLSTAFLEGTYVKIGGTNLQVSIIEIGDLALPSGRVIVADPFAFVDPEPLTLKVQPGQYPIHLSLVDYPDWSNGLIVAAKIQFADLPAVSWLLAVTPRQDPRKLKEGQIYGFPVDAGSASFLSSEAAELHARKLMPTWGEVDFDYIRQLSSQMEAHLEQGSWAIIEWPENRNLNAALFTSGFGDGFYASYWGYGKNGEIVALVIDFGLLDSARD